jgi:hypothetical protein
MKNSLKISNDFEQLSENSDGFLVSGFSTALGSNGMMHGGTAIGINAFKCEVTNNCNGGNCVSGCGDTPKPTV